jgi:hypothetical protein
MAAISPFFKRCFSTAEPPKCLSSRFAAMCRCTTSGPFASRRKVISTLENATEWSALAQVDFFLVAVVAASAATSSSL